MSTSKTKVLVTILIITSLLVSGYAALTKGQMTPTQTCETCGMMVKPDAQAHLKATDSTGTVHYVDCFRCALKLLPIYGSINISATCDWNGPSYLITVELRNSTNGVYVNSTVVNPQTALFIDGGCTKNRMLYNQAGVDALLANNGISQYSTAIQNVTIPSNSTVMTVEQAALKYAFVSSPDPTPTPTPTAATTFLLPQPPIPPHR